MTLTISSTDPVATTLTNEATAASALALRIARLSGMSASSIAINAGDSAATSLAALTTFLTQAAAEVTTLENAGNPPTPTPPPVSTTLTTDVPFTQMAYTAAPGTTVFRVAATTQPTLSPNDGRFVAATQADSDGMWPIQRGGSAVSQDTVVGVTASAGGQQARTVLVEVVGDRIAPRKKFRNVLPGNPRQPILDLQAAERWKMMAGLTIGEPTHNTIADGYADDPAIWDTGTVPDMFQPTMVWHEDPITEERTQIPTGTAIARFAHNVTIRSNFRVKHITVDDDVMVKVLPSAGQDLVVHADTNPPMGRWHQEASDAESTTLGMPRIDYIITAHPDYDPSGTLMRGILPCGEFRSIGKFKEDELFATADIPAGATSVHLPGLATSGWRTKDLVLFVSTQDGQFTTDNSGYTGAYPVQLPNPVYFSTFLEGQLAGFRDLGFAKDFSEYRRITVDLVNEVISWTDPLLYPHTIRSLSRKHPTTGVVLETQSFNPLVLMCDFSVRIRSADPSQLVNCGHIMHMDYHEYHCTAVQHTGNSTYDITLNPYTLTSIETTWTDGTFKTSAVNPKNIIGRYGVHAHFCGTAIGDRSLILNRVAITRPKYKLLGVGVSTHMSRHRLERVTIHGFLAKSWMSENQPEWTQANRCRFGGATGDGYATLDYGNKCREYHEQMFKRNGSWGCAFDNQSRALAAGGDGYNLAFGCFIGMSFDQQFNYLYDPELRNYWEGTNSTDSLFLSDGLTCGGDNARVNRTTDRPGYGITSIPNNPPPWSAGLYGEKDTPIQFMRNFVALTVPVAQKISGRDQTDRASQINYPFQIFAPGAQWLSHHQLYVQHYIAWHCLSDGAFGWGSGVMYGMRANESLIGKTGVPGIQDIGLGGFNYDGDIYLCDLPGGILQATRGYQGASGDPHNHKMWNVEGQWIFADGTPVTTSYGNQGIYTGKWSVKVESDVNANGALGYGLAAGNNNSGQPLPAGTLPGWFDQSQGHSIQFDPSSNTITLDCNSGDTHVLNLHGRIWDTAGVQAMGANCNPQPDPDFSGGVSEMARTGGYRAAIDLAKDNGVWKDPSTNNYYVCINETRADRQACDSDIYGLIKVPIVNLTPELLTPVSQGGWLMDNPTDSRQTDYRKAELCSPTPIVLSTIAPKLILGANTWNIDEGALAAFALRSDNPRVNYVIGGSHPELVTVALVNGQISLVPASGSRFNYNAVVAANGSNVLALTVTAVDPTTGLASPPQNLTITINQVILGSVTLTDLAQNVTPGGQFTQVYQNLKRGLNVIYVWGNTSVIPQLSVPNVGNCTASAAVSGGSNTLSAHTIQIPEDGQYAVNVYTPNAALNFNLYSTRIGGVTQVLSNSLTVAPEQVAANATFGGNLSVGQSSYIVGMIVNTGATGFAAGLTVNSSHAPWDLISRAGSGQVTSTAGSGGALGAIVAIEVAP